jgi:hypothetical protein
MHPIVWEGDPKPEHEPLIQREVDDLLERGLTRVSDLIFHTITLTDDFEGPTIMVNGRDGDETNSIYATYYDNPEIVTVKGD